MAQEQKRVSFASELSTIDADTGVEVWVESERRFYKSSPAYCSGGIPGPNDSTPIRWNKIDTFVSERRVAGSELDDYFGPLLAHQWRPDQEHWSVTDNIVTYVDDRVTKRVASRLTGSSGPAPAYASSVFAGRNALDFGTTQAHTKRLYTTDASCSATNPFIQFCVWSLRSSLTSGGVWLFGNGDASLAGTHQINGGTGYVNYPGNLINPNGHPLDTTSRLAHASIIGIFDELNQRTRGFIIRSDGRVWHTLDYSYCGATTGQASGIPCVGNTGATGANGAPCMIADHGVVQGKILTQIDIASFIEYLRSQYGFSVPSREVLWDGNSLQAACSNLFHGTTLPNTSAKFFSAVGGRTLQYMLGALKETVNSRSCLTHETEKIYVGNEIVNSISVGLTSDEVISYLSELFSRLRLYGYRKIIYGTCMSASFFTGNYATYRNSVNEWLVARLNDGTIDELVNLHTATAIDGQSCPAELLDPSNTTYFNADGIHLTTAGYAIYFQLWLSRMIAAGC